MKIWLAPLHGITVYQFRNILFKHVSGIDAAITPFLSIQETSKLNVRKWKDILPENNHHHIRLIPQLIGNKPSHFLDTVNALSGLGYTSFNWNIGCPMPAITRKKRGCGLMPYPDMIEEVVHLVTSQSKFKISLKMRLGFSDMSESCEIIQRMNRYDLDFIVIHPRLGIWQYEGVPDLDIFARRVQESKNEIIYSGDITDVASFNRLQQRFPDIRQWMIGRGLLQNPFLAEMVKRDGDIDKDALQSRFLHFYEDLIDALIQERNEKGVLANLKELWHYFYKFFHLTEEELKAFLRMNDFKQFIETTMEIANRPKRM